MGLFLHSNAPAVSLYINYISDSGSHAMLTTVYIVDVEDYTVIVQANRNSDFFYSCYTALIYPKP